MYVCKKKLWRMFYRFLRGLKYYKNFRFALCCRPSSGSEVEIISDGDDELWNVPVLKSKKTFLKST
jgi:hypothetical protein